jgi:hypothetical protein
LFRRILTSKQFRFLVGPDSKEFIVHSQAFSRLSRPLDVLINGHMKEAQDNVAEWDDMQPSTFARLAEFAYTGNYTTPKLTRRIGKPTFTFDDLDAEGKGAWGKENELEGRCSVNAFPTDTTGRYTRFREAKYPAPRARLKAEITTEGHQDYSKIFLCHARVYVAVDKYDILEAKALTLHRLYRTLLVWVDNLDSIQDLVDLVRYVFPNTVRGDRMRTLVAHYASLEL